MEKTIIIKELQNLQKYVGSEYYSNASECSNPNLKIDFLSIAREESDIIDWLNYEFDEHDLPPREYPTSEQVSQAYGEYCKFSCQ